MRRISLYFPGPRKVAFEEASLNPPQRGEVLVETLVSAISSGTEVLVYRGEAPAGMAVDESISSLGGRFGFPIKFGYSVVGRVVGVGPGACPHREGDLVFSFHPHESCFLSPSEELNPIPADLAPEDAVFLPNMESAVNFVMDGLPSIGEQVVVLGQGVVGLLTTSLLSRMPLASLVTADRFSIRRRTSLELGARASVDAADPEAASGILASLKRLEDYAGADLCYELSGNPDALETAIQVTGFDGRVVIGSWYGTKVSRLGLGGKFHRSRIRLISSQVSTIGPGWSGRWTKARRLEVAWSMVRAVRPSRLVTHRFPLEEGGKAFALLDQHPEEAIQVLLTYGP